jgi:hypothetical protein
MLTVPPTTALQPAPLSIEGLPLPISVAIVNLVVTAHVAGFHSDMNGLPNEHSEDACLAARAALVDAIRVELRIKPSIDSVVDEAVSRALLEKHLAQVAA